MCASSVIPSKKSLAHSQPELLIFWKFASPEHAQQLEFEQDFARNIIYDSLWRHNDRERAINYMKTVSHPGLTVVHRLSLKFDKELMWS